MVTKDPLEGREVVSRIGGTTHKCPCCGKALFMVDCVAVCVVPSNTRPKFLYFCNREHAAQIISKIQIPDEPIYEEEEEETP